MNPKLNAIMLETTGLRETLGNLSGKFDGLEGSVDRMGQMMADGFSGLRSVNRSIIATVVRLEEKFDNFERQVATKKDLDGIHMKLDSFAKLFEDSRFRWGIHSDILAQHDKRITKLERRQPD